MLAVIKTSIAVCAATFTVMHPALASDPGISHLTGTDAIYLAQSIEELRGFDTSTRKIFEDLDTNRGDGTYSYKGSLKTEAGKVSCFRSNAVDGRMNCEVEVTLRSGKTKKVSVRGPKAYVFWALLSSAKVPGSTGLGTSSLEADSVHCALDVKELFSGNSGADCAISHSP